MKKFFEKFSLESEQTETMLVCTDCLGDPILKCLGFEPLEEQVCSACAKIANRALTPKIIANVFRNELPKHFEPDRGDHPGYELKLKDMVRQAVRCDSEIVVSAIAEYLEDATANDDDFYFQGQEYCRTPSPFESKEHERGSVLSLWHNIANELTHGKRFFNDTARSFFETLIGEALDAMNAERPGAAALITTHVVGTSFYRSRIASDELEVRSFFENPVVALGAAPKERAANNRMSPAGIPLLYVSRETETCIAEVRPAIGDFVVVGRFQSTAELKFFDLTALNRWFKHEPLSILDPHYRERMKHRVLLKYLHDEISRPVRATDTDYLMTQALAEFIRSEEKWAFDGVAFQSVQHKGGVNYALFDRGAPDSFYEPNWRPTFNLKISADAVSVHMVEGVHYCHNLVTNSRCLEP